MKILRRRAIRTIGCNRQSEPGPRQPRRAYSLLEILVGAGVLAAFIVRIYQAYSAVNQSDRYDAFLAEMNTVYATSQQQYIASASYAGFNLGVLAATMASTYVSSATNPPTLYTPYHTEMTITTVAATNGTTGVANGGLRIDTTIPQAACQRLASSQHDLMDYVVIAGTTLGSSTTPADAETLCGGGSTTTNVDISIIYTNGLQIAL